MPTQCITNPLQRDLADSIIHMLPLDEIRILLACGAKVNDPVTQGLMPLHYAVWQKYYEATQLLLVRGANVNAVDECGYSALHLAAEHGYTDLVKLLLDSGAKVDYHPTTDELYPRTQLCDEPLRLAIRNKHMGIARILLEHGADPNKRYFFGAEINLVLELEYLELLLTFGASPDSRDRSGLTPLMKAARQPQGMGAVLLLLSHGANVNAMADERNDFRTVMHYGVLSGNSSIVNLLTKQGAKLNYESSEYGKPSPLDLAILRGDAEIVRMLIEAGADVNYSSPIIGSPLHVACADNIHHRQEILNLLLCKGADPNLRVFGEVNDRHTQLRPALVEYLASNDKPNTAVVNMLLRYGARVVMKTQFRDPDGVLNSMMNVPDPSDAQNNLFESEGDSVDPNVDYENCVAENGPLFFLLLEASESFDICMIKRSQALTNRQRKALLSYATRPLPLLKQCRIRLHRSLAAGKMYDLVDQLEMPKTLKSYLLYEYD